MEEVVKKCFGQDNFILIDRAFLGLYASFINIKKKSGKRKVIFTSTTCPSPVFAAVFAGLEPVFTDINLNDFLMDYDELEHLINNGSNDIAAVVYIYIFGHISEDIFKIRNLTKNKNVYLIEDVAQGFGCEVKEIKAGFIGDLSVFSFGHSKQIDAGNGGVLFINSEEFSRGELNDEIKNIKRYDPNAELALKYSEEFYAFRKKALDDNELFKLYNEFPNKYKELYFQKINVDWVLVRDKLEYFISHKMKQVRNERANKYHRGFMNSPYKDKMVLPNITDGASIYRYTFLVENKETAHGLSNHLRSHDIHCSNLYIPVSRFYQSKGFNHAVNFAERVINLWVDDIADDEYIEKTIKLITNF